MPVEQRRLADAPEPGPSVPVHVCPADFDRVARDFVDGQNAVMQAYHTLNTTLRSLTGAAGDDDLAQAFARGYPEAVRAVFEGMVRLHGVLGGVAQGLSASGENHRRADAEAAGTDTGGFPPLMPDQCPAVAEPAPIVGEGDASLIGSLADFLNPYPSGHLEKMDEAARAFRAAEESVDSIAGELRSALHSLTGNNTSEDLDALEEFWRRVDGGDATLFGALRRSCETLAAACSQYGTAILDTRNEIDGILGEVVVELVATGVVIVVSEFFTAGGATPAVGTAGAGVLRAATGRFAVIVANAAQALAGAGAIAAVAEAAGALTVATSNAPQPNVAEATTAESTNLTNATTEIASSRATGEVATPRGRPGEYEELTAGQHANYKRYIKKLPAKGDPVQIEILEDGGARLSSKVPSNNIPGSYAEYIKVVDKNGNTVQYVKNTYAPDGSVVHSKVK